MDIRTYYQMISTLLLIDIIPFFGIKKGKNSRIYQITETDKLEKENNNMYDIVGMVGDQYIVKTDKGLKRVKIKASDNKRIGDQIY
jgi:hypothetical protein